METLHYMKNISLNHQLNFTFEDLVTDILNAHITKKFEKTYRIINLRRYPPQSANETRKCAGTPIPYTTDKVGYHL